MDLLVDPSVDLSVYLTIHLSISGLVAVSINLLTIFPVWRILIGPLPYTALVVFHYHMRFIFVSYMSLATAVGLVQLGLVVSFQRVVAVREGLVMVGVAGGCVTITAIHLLLEVAVRNQLGLQHVGRFPIIFWLSGGESNPYLSNQRGTSLLYLPHVAFILVTNLAILVLKLHHNRNLQSKPILTRYQLTRTNHNIRNCSVELYRVVLF